VLEDQERAGAAGRLLSAVTSRLDAWDLTVKLVAVMVVWNEALILPTNLAYHRSIGVDEFRIIDNGSEDETAAVLAHERETHGDVHWTSAPGAFRQSQMVTGLARDAIASGAEWVLPVDADEFWWTPDGNVRPVLGEATEVGSLVCEVDNFVQRRSVHHPGRSELRTMTYRAKPTGTPEEARMLVETGKIAFVEMIYPPKQILRAAPDLVVGIGNHTAQNLAGPAQATTKIRVLHAPIRSRDALYRRAEHGRRLEAVNPSPSAGWHVRRWARLADDGKLVDDWRANSQRRGWLNVGDSRRQVLRDMRLRRAVEPFLG
jgi:hypothetical protein